MTERNLELESEVHKMIERGHTGLSSVGDSSKLHATKPPLAEDPGASPSMTASGASGSTAETGAMTDIGAHSAVPTYEEEELVAKAMRLSMESCVTSSR